MRRNSFEYVISGGKKVHLHWASEGMLIKMKILQGNGSFICCAERVLLGAFDSSYAILYFWK